MQGTSSSRLPLSLPPDPVEELSEPGQQFENWNPVLMQATVWAFETFLQVGADLLPTPCTAVQCQRLCLQG